MRVDSSLSFWFSQSEHTIPFHNSDWSKDGYLIYLRQIRTIAFCGSYAEAIRSSSHFQLGLLTGLASGPTVRKLLKSYLCSSRASPCSRAGYIPYINGLPCSVVKAQRARAGCQREREEPSQIFLFPASLLAHKGWVCPH